MKYLKAGMLVRLSCGSLCVIIYPSSPRFCAKGVLEDGSLINVPSTEAEVLATAPKQDDKMFYRVAYAFGLPVKHRKGEPPVVAGSNGNDFCRFGKGYTKADLSIVYECPLYKEMANLEQQHRELVKQQDKIAEQMADVRSRMSKAES